MISNDLQKIVCLICVILIIALSILYIGIEYRFIGDHFVNYSLLFNEAKIGYNEDNLSIIIGNYANAPEKVISINGLGSSSSDPITLYSSILATKSGKVLDKILFDGNSSYIIQNSSISPIRINNVKIDNVQSGSYEGYLYLKNNEVRTIEIEVTTDPKVVQATIVIVIGILLSILLWEIIFKVDESTSNRAYSVLANKAKELNSYISASNTVNNTNFSHLTTELNYLNNEALKRKKRVVELRNRYLTRSTRIIAADIVQVIGGLLAGIVAFTNDPIGLGYIEIGGIEIAKLIGIGLAMGVLKGTVDR